MSVKKFDYMLNKVKIVDLVLGNTNDTAHRGDHGEEAYVHSQTLSGNPHGTTAGDIGAAPASHGHANTDISGLGTMSTQNANDVAITGGSINISGGTLTLADGQVPAAKVATTEMFVLEAPGPTSTGIPGQRHYAAHYVYECVATNTWVRYAAESTWS